MAAAYHLQSLGHEVVRTTAQAWSFAEGWCDDRLWLRVAIALVAASIQTKSECIHSRRFLHCNCSLCNVCLLSESVFVR